MTKDLDVQEATYKIRINDGERFGSGFLISDSRHLLTASHVVTGKAGSARKIEVYQDSHILLATIKQLYPDVDVALLELAEPAKSLPLTLGAPKPLTAGQPIRAVGYPLSLKEFWHPGIVAGLVTAGQYQISFQVPYRGQLNGISGGPVIDADNNVIGVITKHSTLETQFGTIASVGAFAHRLHIPELTGARRCYTILSDHNGSQGFSLESSVKQALELLEVQRSEPFPALFHRATDLLESTSQFADTVRLLCTSEIVIFDVTDYQPAVMLLLGVRSVVRRGVTITSTAESDPNLGSSPFNLLGVNSLSHAEPGPGGEHPRYILKKKIDRGLRQLAYHDYSDLPAYNAIRNLLPGSRTPFPADQQLLVLCPYEPQYTQGNWKSIEDGLRFGLEKCYGSTSERPVLRVLDINVSSPRLIPDMIYESIRRAEGCVVDWTKWRANVFFELGVRLASCNSGTVSIIDDAVDEALRARAPSQSTKGRRKDNEVGLLQKKRLLALFRPVPYSVKKKDMTPYEEAVRRIRSNYSADGLINADFTYQVIASIGELPDNTLTTPVYKAILAQVELLRSDDREGRSAVLYPENKTTVEAVERVVTKWLMAAWLSMMDDYDIKTLVADDELRDNAIKIGEQLAARILNSNKKKAAKIFRVVEQLTLSERTTA